MAGHALIDAHLARLARDLPPAVVEELADGLTETYEHHRSRGLGPTTAATVAITEFGHPAQITAAFTHHAPGRRAAFALLATGPILATCWAASLIAGRAWTWPIPLPAALAAGLTLLAVVATLAIAATSRHNYRRTRLALAGAIGLVLLDTAGIATTLLAAPAIVWPMIIAVAASFVRLSATAHTIPRLIGT